MGLQITSLWDKLKVSEEERDRWLSSHCGLGQSVIDAVRQLCYITSDSRSSSSMLTSFCAMAPLSPPPVQVEAAAAQAGDVCQALHHRPRRAQHHHCPVG